MSGDMMHIDIGEELPEPPLLLTVKQAVVVCFNRADTYLAGEVEGLDEIGLLVACWWKTEEGIERTQDSFVPWSAIESVDLCDSVDEAVRTVWSNISL
jgi:hypothetical protein